MPRYADPAACPDCGGPIGGDASRCARCGLLLAGPTAVELYWTLQRADELLENLRAASVAAPTPAGPVPAPLAPGSGSSSAAAPAPTPSGAVRSRRWLSGASVPRILLGLGALCLVVAALVFMVVTWARLGVGGRTLVLVAATVAAGAASVWANRRSLPGAAEALTVVAVALGALDAFGAVDAGWFGDLDAGATVVAVGAVVTALSVLLGVLHDVAAAGTGRAEQALFAAGCAAIAVGAQVRTDEDSVVLAVTSAVVLALGYAARHARLSLAALCLLLVGLVSSLALLAVGVDGLSQEPLTFSHTLLHGGAAELLFLGVLGVVAASLPDLPRRARSAAAVAGLGLLGSTLTAFLLDEGPTGVGCSTAGLGAAAGLASVLVAGVWRPALRLLAALWSTVALLVAATLAAEGVERYGDVHRWLAQSFLAPAAAHTTPDRWVGLVVVPPLVVLALAAVAARTRADLGDRARPVAAAVVGAAAIGGYAAAVVVPTPLIVLTVLAGSVALAGAAWAVRAAGAARVGAFVAAHVVGGVAVAVSFPAPALLLGGTLAWAAACGVLVVAGATRLPTSAVWITTVVWVLLAVPAALAIADWLPPVGAALVVSVAAVLLGSATAAALPRADVPVAAGLTGAAAALAAAAVSVDPAGGADLTWGGSALALAAAAGACAAARPAEPGIVSVRDLLRVTAAGALVIAFLAAIPAVGAIVDRAASDPWSASWRDRLPRLAEESPAVGPAAQTALVGALVASLLVLLLVLASTRTGRIRADVTDRAAGGGRAVAPGVAPLELVGPAAGLVLATLGWMFLPSRAVAVAAGVALAAAVLVGPLLVRPGPEGRPARHTSWVTAAGVLVLLALTTLGALPSQVLFVAATAAATLALTWLALRGQVRWAAAPAVVVGAVALVSGTLAAGAPQTWSAAPVLALTAVAVVLGALRRRTLVPVEAAFTVAAVGAASVAVDEAGATAWAAHFAIVGALAAGHGATHADRRAYAWAGSVLLAASTWVRLADAEVSVVEAYTLPSALALLGLGLWRLRGDDAAGSIRALGSGLVLATLPSLLQVWADPVSLRALLLGLGCLGLVLAGAARSLAAPLLIGAAVGAVVVLAEVWPVIGSGPQWVPLTVAGLMLLVCGATWEARVRDLRRAGAYLAALR